MTHDSPAGGDDELLGELRRLAERFPVPHPSWHRFVPEMRAVIADLEAAIDALERLPKARAALERQVEGEAEYPGDDAGGPTLREARRRLRELPLPAGEHPYLDEIVLAIDAAEAALAALASVAGGEQSLAAQRRLRRDDHRR